VLDVLASALAAVRDPRCARWLGPLVPGATMVGGARVPGTSYELDPVKAAFDVTLACGWPVAHAADPQLTLVAQPGGDAPASMADPANGPAADDVRDLLGALLAAADWESRRRSALGLEVLTVAAFVDALIRARRLNAALARPSAELAPPPAEAARPPRVRTVAAAGVTALLGGSPAQVAAAAGQAWLDGAPDGAAAARETWGIADAASRGVRLALLALGGAAGAPLPPDVAAALEQHSGDDALGGSAVVPSPDTGGFAAAQRRFEAAIAGQFPARQAAALVALTADPARLRALPLHEFVSATVRA
jgi:2-methylcitrate dehydratase